METIEILDSRTSKLDVPPRKPWRHVVPYVVGITAGIVGGWLVSKGIVATLDFFDGLRFG
jgi:hypothetical protein